MTELARLTWREAEEALARKPVALLPIGAIEAHGPHLPLDTDILIAEEMARRAARMLQALVLPTVAFTPAPFASKFPGTLSIAPEALAGYLRGIAAAWKGPLCFVNSHLDPAHLEVVRAVAEATGAIFPDKTRKPWASRLPEEFKRGGPHGGCYETSLVLAADASAVGDRSKLPKVDVDLGAKLREGARDFTAIGATEAYTGDPASATREEGERLYTILTEMIVLTVQEARHA